MQKDFHYYVVALLAKYAGFEEEDVSIIAHASQFVDDAVESSFEQLLETGLAMNSFCTAHDGLDIFQPDTQVNACLPFHFIPPDVVRSSVDSFVTQVASHTQTPLLYQLIAQVRDRFELHRDEQQRVFSLCSLGVLIHTYMDTWAHQNFSGRNHPENDVENIWIKNNGEWEHPVLKNIYYDFLPQIGHAQAGFLPDLPYLVWKYTNAYTETVVERDNSQLFLEAAESGFSLLASFISNTESVILPHDLREFMRDLLLQEGSLEERCLRWENAILKLGIFDSLPEYQADSWTEQFAAASSKNAQQNSYLANFYKAAQTQRDFVLSKIVTI